MTRQRKFGSAAAIGGSIAAFVLLAGTPAARADELADLRANQELLQKRIDQLSQAPPAAPGPFVPGFGPETRPATAPVTTGSFPRSFLIPGTDTSLRIGGIAWTNITWYFQGHGGAPRSTAKAAIPTAALTGWAAPGCCPIFRSTVISGIRAPNRSTS